MWLRYGPTMLRGKRVCDDLVRLRVTDYEDDV